jgi:capsular polysaccharide transport system ATP-binding protein
VAAQAPTTDTTLITFEDVSKAYKTRGGTKQIVDGLSCVIPEGTNLGILGGNGAGKSTLMRLIAGTEEPDHGRIKRSRRVSFPLGFSGTFAGSLSGRENAIFLARVYGASTQHVVEFAEDFAEIGSYYDVPVSTYSSGMRSRLAFGISMAIDFDVYLVDEVTAVGDVVFQDKCRIALTERFSYADVIMISHAPETLKQYCNCGAVLHQGELKFYATIDDANAAYLAGMKAIA